MDAQGWIERTEAAARDRDDPLAPLRDTFLLPEGLIYLDGNSLGPLPRAVAARIDRVVSREWGNDLIRSWNTNEWIDLPFRVGARIAPLIGAKSHEVVVADSTSINLFKLLASALSLRPGRSTILSEAGNFPTDIYVAEGLSSFSNDRWRLRQAPATDLHDALDDDVGVVMLTHVDYRTGRMHDMDAMTKAAHDHGALMLWDLSHSTGAVPVDLDSAGVDFAIGCGYKYLNGGPGAPSFLYVAERWHDAFSQPLTGWLGHADPFAFEGSYRPASGVARALCGTPPVLSLSALDAALDVWRSVELAAVRAKSLRLGDLFIAQIEPHAEALDLKLATPRAAELRGSQVSYHHPQGHAAMQALIAEGVIGDFRTPDIMRFGFAPLYVRYVDVWDAAERLIDVLRSGRWRNPEFQKRSKVT